MTKFTEKTLAIEHFYEPQLEFGYGQKTSHPKDGLFLYGPHARSGPTKEIRIGIIGSAAGIAHFKKWADLIKNRVVVPPPGKGEKIDRLHLANFPGLEPTFGIRFDPTQSVAYPLDPREIDRTTRILNLHEAVAKTVDLYASKARRIWRTMSAPSISGCLSFPKSFSIVADPVQSAPAYRWKKATSASGKRKGQICLCLMISSIRKQRTSLMTFLTFIDRLRLNFLPLHRRRLFVKRHLPQTY